MHYDQLRNLILFNYKGKNKVPLFHQLLCHLDTRGNKIL
jgi:hypothetical protein